MRYFAIGLKGWVQIRKAMKPPVLVETSATKVVKGARKTWDTTLRSGWGDYAEKPYKKRFVIKTAIYNGGKVIATLQTRKFSNLFKASIREHALIELPKEMIDRIELTDV